MVKLKRNKVLHSVFVLTDCTGLLIIIAGLGVGSLILYGLTGYLLMDENVINAAVLETSEITEENFNEELVDLDNIVNLEELHENNMVLDKDAINLLNILEGLKSKPLIEVFFGLLHSFNLCIFWCFDWFAFIVRCASMSVSVFTLIMRFRLKKWK